MSDKNVNGDIPVEKPINNASAANPSTQTYTSTTDDVATASSGETNSFAPEPRRLPQKKSTITRRHVLALAGCGVSGLVVGGLVSTWGVTQASIASGRIEIRTTPSHMIVTDRARCSGCQRCEMACTLKNDGRVCQHIARVRVRDNYAFGVSADTGDGVFGSCEFTVEHCKQCADPWCMNYCPVHAIYADEKSGARTVDTDRCIGCGMCSQACPWNMPRIDTETGVSTKCISCGRCAAQCPNGAIQFIDWQDIAQTVIDQGVVRTTTLVST